MKRKILFISGLLLLPMVQSVHAMTSAAYHIDWLNQLSGSGGPSSSPGYQINLTVGQTVNSTSSSSAYNIQSGYWAGATELQPPSYSIFLPEIVKAH